MLHVDKAALKAPNTEGRFGTPTCGTAFGPSLPESLTATFVLEVFPASSHGNYGFAQGGMGPNLESVFSMAGCRHIERTSC